MIFKETLLKGAFIIEIERFQDERGFFGRTWCADEMYRAGLDPRIVQINTSTSRLRGTLRGLHYQESPFRECKMIRCTRGAIYNLIVDLRPESSTFLQWFGAELNAVNQHAVYSPEGFAQGFMTLEDDTEIIYSTNRAFAPEKARGIRYNDPLVKIQLPFEPSVISDADLNWPDIVPPAQLRES